MTAPLPEGFDDVEAVAETGHGTLYSATAVVGDGRGDGRSDGRVGASVGVGIRTDRVAVLLAPTPIRDRAARRRLRTDCLAAAPLNGTPGILSIRDLDFTPDHRPYLVSDAARGTLAQRIESGGPLSVPEVAATGRILVRALMAAHAQGILHRGIGPDAVFINQAGEVSLGHFALAWTVRAPSQPDVAASAVVHAPRESFGMGELTPATDAYGLASTLRTALVGRAPYAAEAAAGRAALYHRVLQGGPPPMARPDIPIALATLLDRMLDPEPNNRPGLDELGRTLDTLGGGDGSWTARPAPTLPQPVLPPTRPITAQFPASPPASLATTPPHAPPAPVQFPAPAPASSATPPHLPPPPAHFPASAQASPQTVPPQPPSLSPPMTARPPSSAVGAAPWEQPVRPAPSTPTAPPRSTAHPSTAPPSTPSTAPPSTPPPPSAPAAPSPAAMALPWLEPGTSSVSRTSAAHLTVSVDAFELSPSSHKLPAPRRDRTNYVLLATAAAIALVAGVVWGIVTSSGSGGTPAATATQPTPIHGQAIGATPLPSEVQASYRPLSVTVTAGSATEAVVSWTPPASGDVVDSYLIGYNSFGVQAPAVPVSRAEHSVRISGLKPGTHYEFTVSSLILLPGDPAVHLASSDSVGFDTASG